MNVTCVANEKEFEIHPHIAECGIEIRIFLCGKQINPTYSITWENAHDFKESFRQDALEHLIEVAKDDLNRGVYVGHYVKSD